MHKPYCNLFHVKNLTELKNSGFGHVNGWIKTNHLLLRVDKVLRLTKGVTMKYKNFVMPIPESKIELAIDLSWLNKFRHVGSKTIEFKKAKLESNIDNLELTSYQLNIINSFMKTSIISYTIEEDLIAIYDIIGVRLIIKGVLHHGKREGMLHQEN